MNFLNYDLASADLRDCTLITKNGANAYENLRDCTLITKNGAKIVVNIDSIEFSGDVFPKFEGRIMSIKTAEPKLSYEDYCKKDVELTRNLYRTILNSMYGTKAFKTNYIPEIKNVIFNDPATIVFWDDGTKTVVKCQPGDSFDPEKGLAMAITKKAYGNKGSYCNQLKKWLPKEEPVDTNRSIFVPKEFTFTASFMKGIKDGIDSIFNGTRRTSNDNNVPSKKCMTFREEAAKLHPYKISPNYVGGVLGCPRDIETCPDLLSASERNCRACWDREIPDDLMDND